MGKEDCIENDVYIQNIVYVTRPDGTDAIRIDFVFDTPIMPAENPRQIVLNVSPNPSVPITKPRELKASIILSTEEWAKVKNKYQVGQTYSFKVEDEKITIG